MSRYTPDSKVRVRDAVDMVALVSARTELRRAGPNSYEGLCLFHDERTPSFSVEPVQKVYYCFGCRSRRRRLHVCAGDGGRGLQRRA